MTKYAVMVINNIFEKENLLIIKWNGGQMIERFDEIITRDGLHDSLEKYDMPLDSCIINVVEEDWMGNPKISRW